MSFFLLGFKVYFIFVSIYLSLSFVSSLTSDITWTDPLGSVRGGDNSCYLRGGLGPCSDPARTRILRDPITS